jgi:predicted AlkP superfamily pyrophosphatase or phosphodiesterase
MTFYPPNPREPNALFNACRGEKFSVFIPLSSSYSNPIFESIFFSLIFCSKTLYIWAHRFPLYKKSKASLVICQGFWEKKLGSFRFCVISLTSSNDRSLCPLCLCGSFHEYILPTKPNRVLAAWWQSIQISEINLLRLRLVLKDQSFKFKLKLGRTSSPDKSLGLSKISTSFPWR